MHKSTGKYKIEPEITEQYLKVLSVISVPSLLSQLSVLTVLSVLSVISVLFFQSQALRIFVFITIES